MAAVSLNEQGRPLYLKVNLARGFTLDSISKCAQASLAPDTRVICDGLGCFAALVDAGCVHQPKVVGALKPRELPEFKWVNTALGNLKTTLAGAFHSLNYREYAHRYLAAFAYRFNRRSDLQWLVACLIVGVACAKPAKKSVLTTHAEAGF